MALEFLDGGTLAEKLNHTPQPPRQAAATLEVLARAVHAVHQKQIVHRDLKPSNVLLTSDGTVKISDFGLVLAGDSEATRTPSGITIGTPLYMSPEQAEGRASAVGPSTDIWALGVILYEMLTGRTPFKGISNLETLDQLRKQEPVAPRTLQPKLPRDLETICLKCLRKEPHRRYLAAYDLAEDLKRFLAGEPIKARPVGPIERAWRWCKRKPVVAGLTGLVWIAVLTALGLGLFAAYQTTLAAIHQEASKVERSLKDDWKQSTQMTVSKRLWERGQVAAALQLLDRQRPEKPEDIDYRGWEWHYLKRLCHSDRATFTGLAFSPDGQHLATSCWDDEVRVWDLATRVVLVICSGHEQNVSGVAYSADGSQLASSSWDRTVRLWDARTGRELHCFRGHLGPVAAVAFTHDGKRLVSASDDHTLKVWDLATGKELLTLWGHTSRVQSLSLSADGRRLVSASGGELDRSVRLWNLNTGQELLQLVGQDVVAFSPDGRQLAAAGLDSNVQLFNANPLDDHPIRQGRITPPPGGVQITDYSRPIVPKAAVTYGGIARRFLQPPPDEVAGVGPSPADMRILGYATAKELDAGIGHPGGMIHRPPRDEQEFLVVPLAVLNQHLAPTESEYETLRQEVSRDREERPVGPRASLLVIDPRRFFLELPDGRAVRGELLASWPISRRRGGSFSECKHLVTDSRPISLHGWHTVAVAWVLDAKDSAGPFQVRYAGGVRVPVPALRLPTPPLQELDEDLDPRVRIERAWRLARSGHLGRAVPDAKTTVRIAPHDDFVLYRAAAIHALASTAAQRDQSKSAEERAELAEQLARTAVDLLRQAQEHGFKELDLLKEDNDFDGLRERADFQKLLEPPPGGS
jgi:WD40 repeat protein